MMSYNGGYAEPHKQVK